MGKTVGVVLSLKDKCSPQLSKVAEKLGITENEAKKLNKQAKQLSKELKDGLKKACTVTAAAIGAITVATQQLVTKTIEAGDRVDKMSQKIGMSRQAFQEWDYIMSQNGSSVDTLQMGYKKLSSQMDAVRKGSKESVALFKQLGVSVKDNRGQLRSQEDVFNDTVRALQRIKNPTEKAIMANKLFGKSAIELMPLLNQSADSVDTLRKRANDLGMVMSDEAVDASVKLTDTFDTIQRSINGLGLFIGSKFLPVIQEMSDKFIDNMPKIKAVVTPILEGLLHIVDFAMTHIKGLSIAVGAMVGIFATCTIINTTAQALSTLGNIINFVKASQGVWNALMLTSTTLQKAQYIGTVLQTTATTAGDLALKAYCATKSIMIGLMNSEYRATLLASVAQKAYTAGQWAANIAMNACPVIAIITGVVALVAGLVWLTKNWDKVTEAVKNFSKVAFEKIQSLWDKIKPIFEKIKKAAEIAFKFTPAGMVVNTVKTVAENVKPKKHALGTSYSTGGPAIVGEYGPELLNLKKGDTVTPAPKTQQILKNNTQKIEINVNIAGNLIGNGEFLEKLKNTLALELTTALATT